MLKSSPASIYLFKVKEGNTRRSVCGIYSELRGIFRTQSNISLRLLANYFCRKAPLLCSIWVLNKPLNLEIMTPEQFSTKVVLGTLLLTFIILHTLGFAHVSYVPYMNVFKKRILMNAFFKSQFSYCRLIWMCHSRTNNKINRLHERLRIIFSDKQSSFETLLEKDRFCFYSQSQSSDTCNRNV